MSVDDTWPKQISKGHNDLIAIGAIALGYGELEGALQNLFSAATTMRPEHISSIFYRLPNNTRFDVLLELTQSAGLTKELSARIKYCVECCKICAENRNSIMHSHRGGEYHDARLSERGMILSKYSKAGKRMISSARLKDLRQVADEIHEITKFAHGTAMNVRMFWDHKAKGRVDEFKRLLLVKEPKKPTPLEWSIPAKT
ncbi:hypothetical protein NLM31_37090 [Bradyrhizobium sp. CCGUVB4N]|uniref:hypothetical protein n=1 Tax=Bradyrhizobium sp. CCGUVB4N TaxID=2949631 RepID=UPI0020B43C21|nr:hypothetical protein [Bradyrhizobium sp. CCGUVB4N]MCP3386012.1 hypothetical protein [Bradyrhizobium sp. CCGUVB4N]